MYLPSCHRSSSNISSTPSLLKELYDVPVDTLATEKSYYLIDKDILASQQNDFKCFYCGKVLASRAGRVNHEKKHRKSIIKEKRQKTVARRRGIVNVYRCEECDEEFGNKGSLTKHMKKHSEEIECEVCHKRFKDKMDYEWHDAYEDHLDTNETISLAQRTRSKTRLSCHSIAKKMSRPKSCDPIMTFSPMSATFLGAQSISHFSTKSTPYKKLRNELTSDSEDSDSDDLSEDAENLTIQDDDTIFRDSPVQSTWNNFDESYFSSSEGIACPESACDKVFSNIDWLTLHEIDEHNKLALFRCTECRKRYTTR